MSRFLLAVILIVPVHGHTTLLTTVADGSYEISTITCAWDDAGCGSVLMTQDWWGDEALTMELATLLGTSLGLPNLIASLSPYFAFEFDTTDSLPVHSWAWCGTGPSCPTATDVATASGFSATWAIGVRVPEPDAIALLGAGLLGFVLMRRRKSA